MEFLSLLLFVWFFILPVVLLGVVALSSLKTAGPSTPRRSKSSATLCEERVTDAIASLGSKSYYTFTNLVLESRGNTPHTEIDHVVISPYGIFCIETKSHNGNIYGSKKSGTWTQYLGNQKYPLYNPYRQNYKHIMALENLLVDVVKEKIHSCVVFPNARKVMMDGQEVHLDIEALLRHITSRDRQIYNFHDCKVILRTLAYASSKSEELVSLHVAEVNAYLHAA